LYRFRDERGKAVRLSSYFAPSRPVVLAFVYYECPMLCTLLLNGAVEAMKTTSLVPGRDFQLVVVSVNPRETPALAAAKKKVYLELYGHPDAAPGFAFLTSDEADVTALARKVGFRYAFDPKTGQYDHTAALIVLTPAALVSRYLYGTRF